MRPAGTEAEVLTALAQMPFLDRTGMVAVTARSKGAVYEAVKRLEEAGLCTPIPHAAILLSQAQRYHLTVASLHRLAGEEGSSPDDLLRERPLSAQWRRSLMERLDALSSIYRLAAGIAAVEYPVRFRWYRSLPLDAAVELPGGRSVGIVRRGNTADRSMEIRTPCKARRFGVARHTVSSRGESGVTEARAIPYCTEDQTDSVGLSLPGV